MTIGAMAQTLNSDSLHSFWIFDIFLKIHPLNPLILLNKYRRSVSWVLSKLKSQLTRVARSISLHWNMWPPLDTLFHQQLFPRTTPFSQWLNTGQSSNVFTQLVAMNGKVLCFYCSYNFITSKVIWKQYHLHAFKCMHHQVYHLPIGECVSAKQNSKFVQ